MKIMEYKDKKYTYLGGLVHGISTLATGMKTSIKVYFRKKVTEQYPDGYCSQDLKIEAFEKRAFHRGVLEGNNHRNCVLKSRLQR